MPTRVVGEPTSQPCEPFPDRRIDNIALEYDMIRSVALAIVLLAASQARAFAFVTVEEGLPAPPEQQVSYVAGILDTLLSSSTGALAKDTLEHFVHCVSDSHLTPG